MGGGPRPPAQAEGHGAGQGGRSCISGPQRPPTGPEPRWVSVRTAAVLQSGASSTHIIACTWSSTQLATDTRVDAER